MTRSNAEAWDEGYAAAKYMARLWGYVGDWEDEPDNPYQTSTEASEGRPSGDARQSGSTPAGTSVEHLEALGKSFRWQAGRLRDGLSTIAYQVDQDSPWAASIRGKARGYDECAAKLESAIRKAAER